VSTDYARTTARPVTVTRYRGSITYVRHLGDGSDELTYADCPHEHTSAGAADRCAQCLARRHTRDVR
jgi:hypothetical protein